MSSRYNLVNRLLIHGLPFCFYLLYPTHQLSVFFTHYRIRYTQTDFPPENINTVYIGGIDRDSECNVVRDVAEMWGKHIALLGNASGDVRLQVFTSPVFPFIKPGGRFLLKSRP